MECSEAREHFSAFDRNADPIKEIVDHLAGCSACRVERSKYQELVNALGGLAELNVEPPHWLLASLTEVTMERARRMAALKDVGKQLTTPKVATGGAIVLAGMAGALIFGRKRRRTRKLRVGGLAAA